MQPRFDRAAEDLGNVVKLEHVNVRITDQRLSTLFYVAGLGFTRDPFIMVSTNNMWINMGTSQFHLPTGGPDVLRGVSGLVVPDRKALLDRLAKVKGELARHQIQLRREERLRRGDLPLGQSFPHPRAGREALRPDRARPALSRVSTSRKAPPTALRVSIARFSAPKRIPAKMARAARPGCRSGRSSI